MKPVAPAIPMVPRGIGRPHEVVLGKNSEYQPLPAALIGDVTVTRWRLSFLERLEILFFGHVWLSQMNFGQPLQPVKMETEQPEPYR